VERLREARKLKSAERGYEGGGSTVVEGEESLDGHE